jgi:hypothetical protein
MPTGTGMAGVRYGEGVELQQLQRSLPTPNARASTPTAPAAPANPSGAPSTPAGQPPQLPSMPKPGLLLAPTNRPNEAVTTGLNRGPGAGPEVLGVNPVQSPTGKFLRDLARITGRERFNELARRSGL